MTVDQRDIYQQIVESAHEGVWVHDLSGRTIYANVQMAELLGYPLEEMLGLCLTDLLDDEGARQAQEMLERERLGPLTEQVDCRYVRKDGSNVWCLVARSPLLEDGQHRGSINLVSDISERKRIDESLRRSSDLLAEAQRAAHLGSWGWDLTEDVLDWTEEMYRILGRTPTAAAPTFASYLEQVHPDDRDRVRRLVEAETDNCTGLSYECRIVRPDGEVVWVHAEGETATDAAGGARTLRGTLLDITAYKRATEEVERTSARYRLLQRMATAANEDSGLEQVLRLAVQEILRHTGWPTGRAFLVTGRDQRRTLEPLAEEPGAPDAARSTLPAELAAPLLVRVLSTRAPVWGDPSGAVDRSPAVGDPRTPGTAFAFPVLVGDEVVAVLEFRTDRAVALDQELLETCQQVGTQLTRVVERQRAADDLAAARDAAMESVKMKSEFLATMSHEIRTPMNGVIGLTHLLLGTELDPRQRQYAEGVQVSGEALLTVINDILDFSKLEAGKVELDREDFEVRRVVEEVAELLAPTADGKGLELLAYCWPDVPDVLVGDSGRIRQILLNLVSNGVKFSADGEVVITVTAGKLADGSVSLRVEVRDTGIGIPEQSRVRLFESFSQADASTTRRYGGTGLGLAISQRLVEAMGGTIGFDSEVGVGSTFWFEIPLRRGTAVPVPTERIPEPLTGLRVLVVDDNATNRMILQSQLESWQLVPDLVDNAPAALVRLRSMAEQGQPYALAVLDMCMPDMDGLELAQQVSADATLAGTRMILLTSTSQLDAEALALAGVREWLTKPVRSADLLGRLLRLMAPHPGTAGPTRPATHPPREADPAAPVGSLGRVLVVEDNVLNQLVAEGIIVSLGYTVDIVSDGAEALEAVLATPYDAVLMDCHMPVLDGFEATREIRHREGGGARTPVIAMTAGAMAEDRDRCAAAGMDDFVSKPVELAAVQAALARWIPVVEGAVVVPPPAAEPGWVTEPEWAAEPALDLQRLAQLRQLSSMSGTDLVGRMVGLFASDGRAALDTLRRAGAAGSVDDLRHALHKLKGASANIGAVRVAALCRQLEDEPDETLAVVTGRHLALLQAELGDASEAMAQTPV